MPEPTAVIAKCESERSRWMNMTVRDFFDVDPTKQSDGIVIGKLLRVVPGGAGSEAVEVSSTVSYFAALNVYFLALYVPPSSMTFEVCQILLNDCRRLVDEIRSGIGGHHGFTDRDQAWYDRMQFARRIYLYHEGELSDVQVDYLKGIGQRCGLEPLFRGPEYVKRRTNEMKPVAFVSHDSRDKDMIARPVAERLLSKGYGVWYDEFSLVVGDSLRESIERGLMQCDKCILVLTPNFLSNPSWTQTEFNAAFTREMVEKKRIILPIWHEVTPTDVLNYSPTLADRFALQWRDGADAVVNGLIGVFQRSV